ncbi:MAG: HEPN domain-containing protein [Chloroflexi bacterium]|nr:HEPN domain-containing protein [Chloroflexota bacterium]
MSRKKSRWQAERWLQTAEEDLQAARVLYEHGLYASACFHAEQCGEKAVKALWYLDDLDPWGHSILKLLQQFPRQDELPQKEQWFQIGALLDKFYVPTRYPNGLPDLTPGQVYTREEAEQAIEAARTLLIGCQTWLKSH